MTTGTQSSEVRAALLREARRLRQMEVADVYRRAAQALATPMPKAAHPAASHARAAREAALLMLRELIAGSLRARTPQEWSLFLESIPLACQLLERLVQLQRLSSELEPSAPLQGVKSFRKPTARRRAR